METRKKILLLGGNGFIGKRILHLLQEQGIECLVVDRNSKDGYDIATNKERLVEDLATVSHIVFLASSVGFELFTRDPLFGYGNNQALLSAVADAIVQASNKYKKSFDLTWFSSSEVYWSSSREDDLLDESSPITVCTSDSRSLYMQVKALGETLFNAIGRYHPEILHCVKVVRPFNISGAGQKKGLVYLMVKSAIENRKIYYAKDMTRTITSINYAAKQIVEVILSPESKTVDVVDKQNTLRLETLAFLVKKILEEANICQSIALGAIQPSQCKYRSTSKPDNDLALSEKKLKPIVLEIANELR